MRLCGIISKCWFILMLVLGCSEQQTWKYERQIKLPEQVRPLSVAKFQDTLWISDPRNYRLLKTDLKGNIHDSITNIKRPMNIGASQKRLYTPEYLTDTIWQLENGRMAPVQIQAKLRAPAGITVHQDTIAIADFYNHRIVLQMGDEVTIIGSKGHQKGQLYYPIDMKVFQGKIYVADAYNNRVQVFKNTGELIRVIGANDGLKVASGIDVTKDIIAVTDQEHNRVIIYNHQGKLMQQLDQHITYPTDVLLAGDKLYIANFKDHTLTVYKKKKPVEAFLLTFPEKSLPKPVP